VAAEAELMAAQVDFLRLAGLDVGPGKPDVVLKVSNRQVIQHFLEGLGISGEAFAAVCVVIDKRDKIGDEATAVELGKVGVGGEAARAILDLLATTGLDQAAAKVPADNPGLVALRELMALAEAAGFAHLVRIDLSVIRGLSYYTGTVWEAFDATGAMPRAIAGGGRYDKLMETFGGQAVPMVGFGFGDVVITDILAERGLLPPLGKGIDDVVYPMSAAEFAIGTRVAAALRRQGRAVVVDYKGPRFKNVIERAEKDGAKRLLILGGNEVAAGVCLVRTLGGEKKEEKLPLATLLAPA
jgi:histidyl-tRNA synthetase